MRDSNWRNGLLLLAVALLTLAADQLSKFWIMNSLRPGESMVWIGGVHITYVTNTGVAFGLFRDQAILFVLIAAAVVTMIIVYQHVLTSDALLFRMALGLQLGGAIGNLLDRLRFGYVVDFIDLRFWPVFNIADSAIVVGVFVLVGFLLFAPEELRIMSRRSEGAPSQGDGSR